MYINAIFVFNCKENSPFFIRVPADVGMPCFCREEKSRIDTHSFGLCFFHSSAILNRKQRLSTNSSGLNRNSLCHNSLSIFNK